MSPPVWRCRLAAADAVARSHAPLAGRAGADLLGDDQEAKCLIACPLALHLSRSHDSVEPDHLAISLVGSHQLAFDGSASLIRRIVGPRSRLRLRVRHLELLGRHLARRERRRHDGSRG